MQKENTTVTEYDELQIWLDMTSPSYFGELWLIINQTIFLFILFLYKFILQGGSFLYSGCSYTIMVIIRPIDAITQPKRVVWSSGKSIGTCDLQGCKFEPQLRHCLHFNITKAQ